jgi:DNA primase
VLGPRNRSIGAGASDVIRAHILTATLLAHPALFPDVEEAFSRVPLPPACDRLRGEISNFVAGAKTLDSETLLTHLSGLGLAEEARLVEATAAGHYRPDSAQNPAETVAAWWSWYLLMDCNMEMLRQHRDEEQLHWQANPDDPEAWARLVKYNELLARARHGEYEPES